MVWQGCWLLRLEDIKMAAMWLLPVTLELMLTGAFCSWCFGTFPIISMAPRLLCLECASCFHGWLALHKPGSFWHCHHMVPFEFSTWIWHSHCACSEQHLYPDWICGLGSEKEHLYFSGCQELLEPLCSLLIACVCLSCPFCPSVNKVLYPAKYCVQKEEQMGQKSSLPSAKVTLCPFQPGVSRRMAREPGAHHMDLPQVKQGSVSFFLRVCFQQALEGTGEK